METQLRDSETSSVELEVPVLEVCIRDATGTPVMLSSPEHQEFFTNLIKAIACAMNKMSLLSDAHEAILNVDQVTKNGSSYAIATAGDPEIEQGILKLCSALETDDFDNLSIACIHYLEQLTKMATKLNYDFQFSSSGIDDVPFVTTGISQPPNLPDTAIPGGTSIYGKLVKVELQPPQIRLEISKGPTLDISVSTQIAETLIPKLNKRIGLVGTAYWRTADLQIVDFKVKEVSPYDPDIPMAETLRRLRKIIGDQWDHIEEEKAFVSDLKSRA